MSAYHQMGHDSRNLLSEKNLAAYRGAILSPINYTENEVMQQIDACDDMGFEFVLDPQLYYPNTARGKLTQWSYFPSDVDTADQSSNAWWQRLVSQIAETAERLQPAAVCSPSIVPRLFSMDYYSRCCEVTQDLRSALAKSNVGVLLSLLVRLGDLGDQGIVHRLASLISAGDIDRVFLVFVTDVEPRKELRAEEELKGAMRLIRYLEMNSIRVLVGYSSSDVVLWKAAGASDCATGKYFNVRRFTPSRWEPATGGGNQFPYWFEESLMAFLRESDLIRVKNAGLLTNSTQLNPYGAAILDKIGDSATPTPWLSLSWRQYLYWFANFEFHMTSHPEEADRALVAAENAWGVLETSRILMEEPANNGTWLRGWRRAIIEAF